MGAPMLDYSVYGDIVEKRRAQRGPSVGRVVHAIPPACLMPQPAKMIGAIDRALDFLNLLQEIVPEHLVSCHRACGLSQRGVVVK